MNYKCRGYGSDGRLVDTQVDLEQIFDPMTGKSDCKYIAYIDEAGDDGLKSVRPLDPTGSSEWLVLSAAVIDASREEEIPQWKDAIHTKLWNQQSRDLHFQKLSASKKLIVCREVAKLPVRLFVVCSNKQNMRGYRNPRAEQIPSKNWFYCWMTRLLLERVTHFVAWHSQQKFERTEKVRVEFSNRGGMSYSQFRAYLTFMWTKGENNFLRAGSIDWDVIDKAEFYTYPHHIRPGLFLPDVTASAFFKACDIHNTGAIDTRFAEALSPRIARPCDDIANDASGYGLKLMPRYSNAPITDDQRAIFRQFGYPKEWWAPDPLPPSAF